MSNRIIKKGNISSEELHFGNIIKKIFVNGEWKTRNYLPLLLSTLNKVRDEVYEQERKRRKEEKCKTAEISYEAGKFEAMKQVMECLPGTVILDIDFYEDENSKKFNEWKGFCDYKDKFLENLKSKGLIK